MFSEELKKISWEETTERIAHMTDTDVRRALAKEHCDVNDFMALLSPAAEPSVRGNTQKRDSERPCQCSFRSISPTPAATHASIADSIAKTQWHAPFSHLSR